MIDTPKIDLPDEPISFVETPQEIADLMVELITQDRQCAILDTGCGRGAFLKSLLAKQFQNMDAIELNKPFATYCETTYNNVSVHEGNYLTWHAPRKYDLIIGNPPYAHFNSLPVTLQKLVSKITKTRESDLYYAFIIKSLDLLAPNGELIYIVPYGFFYNTHAKLVRRKLVENGFIQVIIDLDETRLFQDEHPETIIFKFLKRSAHPPDRTTILRVKNRNAKPKEIYKKALKSLTQKNETTLFTYHTRPPFRNQNEIWSTYPQIELPISVKLKDVAYIGVGLVSGFALAFRIQDEVFNCTPNEQELISDFVKGANCAGFWVDGTAQYILMNDQVKSETELARRYPNIYSRLKVHKIKMSNRYLPNKKQWFHWQALRNKSTIERFMTVPKIFVPTLDRSTVNRFSLTSRAVYPSGDVLCIVPQKIDPSFLLGYLNSAFFRDYYLSYGARRGHRIAFTQRILSNIKIPWFSKEVVRAVKTVSEEILATRDQSKRERIDEIIQQAFDQHKFQKPGLLKYLA
jgi:adenine-specific DNA-methyltransferase